MHEKHNSHAPGTSVAMGKDKSRKRRQQFVKMQQAEINALKDYNMMSFMDNKEHEDAMKKKAPAAMQKKRTFGPKEVKSILPGKGKMAKGHSIYEH